MQDYHNAAVWQSLCVCGVDLPHCPFPVNFLHCQIAYRLGVKSRGVNLSARTLFNLDATSFTQLRVYQHCGFKSEKLCEILYRLC